VKISDSVRSALSQAGKQQKDLAEFYGKSKQSMSTKMTGNRWFGHDLVRIAEFCGADLAFVFPDGSVIKIRNDEDQEEE